MSLADTLAGKALANSGADVPHPLSEIIGGITHMTHGCALACVFVPFLEVMSEKHKKDFDELAHILDPNLEETADGSKQLAQIVRPVSYTHLCNRQHQQYKVRAGHSHFFQIYWKYNQNS